MSYYPGQGHYGGADHHQRHHHGGSGSGGGQYAQGGRYGTPSPQPPPVYYGNPNGAPQYAGAPPYGGPAYAPTQQQQYQGNQYGGGQYNGGPPQYGGGQGGYPQNPQYPPPHQRPPPGLDAYGYPQQQRQQGYAPHQQGRSGPPPPSAPQHFGGGAPGGYTFQYSNCSGKRKALLIGINYFGQQNQLRGCINDVHNVSAFLVERYGYRREDMVILTDDQRDPVRIPTKANIIRAIGWLVSNAQPNDALFLHYSGHGGQTKDLSGDEDDGFDEVIYPVDYKQAGHIVDDDLHYYVVKPLRQGVRLTAIFDSCHSATVLDLPYVYSTKGVLKEPNLAKEAGMGLLGAISSYARGDMMGVASTIFGLAKSAVRGDEAYEKTKQTRTSPADVIMWSGSKDDQTSADASIAQQATGAMSWAFITAIKQNPQQSYVELLNSIREVLATKYTQKPQLSCSHPLDTNLLFVM